MSTSRIATTLAYSACCLLLASLMACVSPFAPQFATDINESVAKLHVSVKDFYGRPVDGTVVVTQYKPDGAGPFPIVVLSHGRSAESRDIPARVRYTEQARYFIKHGFAVFVPTRIGYGAEGLTPDPEDSGGCRQKSYGPMAEAASTEILAVIDYAKQQPYADPHHILLVGQSVGGYSTTAAAAKNPDGVIAAINFAGGAGGNPTTHPGVPCQGDRLQAMYAQFGATSHVPMLWVYTKNDLYFGPQYSQAWHAAYSKAGGQAEFVLMPPFSDNGHKLFGTGIAVWGPVVSHFLQQQGFN